MSKIKDYIIEKYGEDADLEAIALSESEDQDGRR